MTTPAERPDPLFPLRPHHALCIPRFRGMGYSPAFTSRMTQVSAALRQGGPVRLTCAADVLCSSCPHCENGACSSEKPARLDAAVLTLCGLREGDVLPWKDLLARTHGQITEKGLLPFVCAGCEWLSLCNPSDPI